MRHEQRLKDHFEPQINPDNPILRHLRACKKIEPRDEAALANWNFRGRLPRIVKLDFKTPPNWKEVSRVLPGEELAPGLIHTCERPYKRCSSEGYWLKRKE